jgi:hypothetical protein
MKPEMLDDQVTNFFQLLIVKGDCHFRGRHTGYHTTVNTGLLQAFSRLDGGRRRAGTSVVCNSMEDFVTTCDCIITSNVMGFIKL